MATIQKRGNRYRVQIRRAGQPNRSATIGTLAEAKRWAEAPTTPQERHDLREAREKGPTLATALERYAREVSPRKKGEDRELYLIRAWQRDPLAQRRLADIDIADIAKWRDAREKEGASPSSIRNRLYHYSAKSGWGKLRRCSAAAGGT